jgi:membrane protease YdiL (CAAX protease family)
MPVDHSESATKPYPEFFQEELTIHPRIEPFTPSEWGVGSIVKLVLASLVVLVVFSCLLGIIIGIAMSPYYGVDETVVDKRLDKIGETIDPVLNVGFIIIPLWLIYYSVTRRHHRNFCEALRIHRVAWADIRPYAVLGVGIAAIVVAIMTIIEFAGLSFLIPEDMPINKEIQSGYARLAYFTVMALMAAILEEILFRGYIFQGLRHSWNSRAAAIIVTAVFILIHWPQLGFALIPLLLIVPISVIIMLIRIKRDSLSYCMITHMSYNGTLLLLTWAYVAITGQPINEV